MEELNMKVLDSIIDFVKKQDTFIRIGFYVGASFLIVLAGYWVGGFIARITG
jgi:hypothetical protein